MKANPNNSNISYQLGQTLLLEKKPELYPQALWSFARAAAYDGPGSLPASNRTQVQAYFKKIYDQYHGSDEGADQLLAQAKASALPPEGFKMESAVGKANQAAADLQQKLQADPALSLWYSLQQSLTADQGDAFFTNSVKDADIPGGANGIKDFTGTVISMDPPDRPTKIVLGVLDPDQTGCHPELPGTASRQCREGRRQASVLGRRGELCQGALYADLQRRRTAGRKGSESADETRPAPPGKNEIVSSSTQRKTALRFASRAVFLAFSSRSGPYSYTSTPPGVHSTDRTADTLSEGCGAR